MSAQPMPNIWGVPVPGGAPSFDLTDDDKKQALNMGLLAAGAGILAGNRGNYGRAGPAIGQGLLSGLQTYQGMQQMARQQKRQDFNDQLQFAGFQQKQDELARARKRQEQMDAALNDPNATEVFGIPAAEARQLYAIGGPEALTKAAASRYESYTLSPGAARFSGGQKIAEVAPENKIAPNGVVYDPRGIKPGQIFNDPNNLMFVGSDGMPVVNRALVGVKKDIARSGASNTSVSYGSPVAAVDANGNPVFIQPSKDGGAPHVIPGVRPAKTAAEEKAEQEKTAKARQAQQSVSTLSDARKILQAGKATGSGIGTVVDAANRAIGINTKSAEDAARLQALSGWMVSNVPRMEGPQSNVDVQNYTTMAGKIGDSTVPIDERLAALDEVERLMRKYAEINGTPLPAAPTQDRPPLGSFQR